jgi:hypothetical protein
MFSQCSPESSSGGEKRSPASHNPHSVGRDEVSRGRPKLTAFLAAAALMLFLLAACGCSGISNSSSSTSHGAPANSYPNPIPGPTGSFFGIATNVATDPWPGTMIPLTSWRTLGSSVKWADINTGPGIYDFSKLDQWLTQAKSSHADVLFTTYATPSWASSRGADCTGVGTPYPGCLGSPNTFCAFQQQDGPGICDPPMDLACDGSGTDQTFINFISAVVQHVGPGTIKYWEMWNEPGNPAEWNGVTDCRSTPNATYIMLARMAKDLKATVLALDHNAQFSSPPLGDPYSAGSWLGKYFANTDAASSTDIIGFHGYINKGVCPSECPAAEQIGVAIDQMVSGLPASARSKPMFDTEGSWGGVKTKGEAVTDPDQQASFLARYYLIQMSKGVAKLYWWNWDISTEAEFYDANTNALTPAASAYIEIVRWTNGGTAIVQPCRANGTVWTCTLNPTDDAPAEAIWDTSQTCSGGTCSTTNQSVPSQFNAYLDLSGNTTAISGSSVPVGFKPILVITQ